METTHVRIMLFEIVEKYDKRDVLMYLSYFTIFQWRRYSGILTFDFYATDFHELFRIEYDFLKLISNKSYSCSEALNFIVFEKKVFENFKI